MGGDDSGSSGIIRLVLQVLFSKVGEAPISWEAVPIQTKFLEHGAAGLVGLDGIEEGVELG